MRIIADAKYKPIDNIGNRDYLQVLDLLTKAKKLLKPTVVPAE